ncbi:MAG: ATP-binding protein [Paludisphaera borealis]|uniref:sensor histidine kinase n=1 Tax=Paludisphaera borealis TaxID=1387353 RepID=UPI00283E1207|nr:ATP-binding protein [Paludisphaera borealis]MDR3621077.1 ATP-binding protein [Paludisphaera borealis]
MLTRTLLLRIAGPSLLMSLVFLVSCTVAAVYLNRRQAATVRALDDNLRSRRIVDDLLRDLNELVVISLNGERGDRASGLHDHVRDLLKESKQAGHGLEEARIVDRLEAGFHRYLETATTPGRAGLEILETDIRVAARDLDLHNAMETARSQAAMHRTASWMAWGLVGVSVVATAAGLLIGYGVVRGLERMVIQAEQMAGVGQIAAGMAHELRNPLTAISMLVQLQREKAQEEGLPAEDLHVIEQEIGRMEERLNAFIDFARPARPRWRRIDLAEVTAQTLSLMQGRASKQRVQLNFHAPAAPIVIEADAEQIGRVLINLGLNALDAMPRGGRLDVALEQEADGSVELTVGDTGPGVDPKHLSRLFEPFFTSKEAGLGLGLPISQRIARDHGGSLQATNRPEGGAAFILRLPSITRTA